MHPSVSIIGHFRDDTLDTASSFSSRSNRGRPIDSHLRKLRAANMSSDHAVDLTESKQSDLRTLLIAMTIVPTVIVLVRAWSRALLPVAPLSKIPTRFWWDDWAAFAAAVRLVSHPPSSGSD